MDTSLNVLDMILSVTFLRNVYTVMAYGVPDTHGMFLANTKSTDLQPLVGLPKLDLGGVPE